MKIQASAGSNRKRSLDDYCYKLTLIAETEEDGQRLAKMLWNLYQSQMSPHDQANVGQEVVKSRRRKEPS